MNIRCKILWSAGILLSFLIWGGYEPAAAAEITVGGSCTLVDAITAANADTTTGGCAAGSGADTLILTGDVVLASNVNPHISNGSLGDTGTPTITTTITIEGEGYTVRRDTAAANFRLFIVGSGGDLTLKSMTLRDGVASGNVGSACGAVSTNCGGAIFNVRGQLTLDNVVATSNQADRAGAVFNYSGTAIIRNSLFTNNDAVATGGAFYINSNPSPATLLIINTTISNNRAGGFGGGGFSLASGVSTSTTTLINTTVSGNQAISNGGGWGMGLAGQTPTLNLINGTISGNSTNGDGGGIGVNTNGGNINIVHTTITGNTADNDANGVGNGGGLNPGVSAIVIKNSIIAGNFDNSPGTIHPDCSGGIVLRGDNILQDTTGCSITFSIGATNNPVNPLLNSLADNGGGTPTHALQGGSPALDTATDCTDLSSVVIPNDQRGVARPTGANCDIGAFEAGTLPTLQFEQVNSTANEGNTALIRVVSSVPVSTSATLYIQRGTGTATVGIDFQPTLNIFSVTIPPGAGSAVFTVNALPDAETEADETVSFSLQKAFGGNLGAPLTHTLNILSLSATPTSTVEAAPATSIPAAVSEQSSFKDTDFVSKTVDKSLALVGDTVTYTIVFANPKGNTLKNVVITDAFDARFQNVRVVSTSLGTASVNGNTVTVQGFEMLPGQRATLIITAQISNRANPGDVISNTASLESPDASIHVSNNATVTILPGSLPATGETPLARWLLLVGVIGVIAVGGLFARRRMMNPL